MEKKQYVIFTIGDSEYGIDITSTEEIVKIPGITKIPGMPNYEKGLACVREQIIPIVDLSLFFGDGPTCITDESRLLVLQLSERAIGLIVSDVSEIIDLEDGAIQALDASLYCRSGKALDGIMNLGGKLIPVLNEKIFEEEVRH